MLDELKQKALVMMVGPTSVGKSTIMNQVAAEDSDFAYVRSFTTRAPRPGEESNYDFIDHSTATALLNSGQTITYFEHPTTHQIYGTTINSYPGKFNLLDTLSVSVKDYRTLAFESTVTIAITAPAEQWRNWFLSRFPHPTPEALQRLDEAVMSINWALADPQVYWLVNRDDQVSEVAKQAIHTARTLPLSHVQPREPHDMLEVIKGGLWPKK